MADKEVARRPVPELTVVIACTQSEHTLERCLRSIREACIAVDSEILLCYPASEPPSASLLDDLPPVERVPVTDAVLVPDLWGTGLGAAGGQAVAFTTAHFIVGPGWARALVDGMNAGWSGAAGPISLADTAGPVDRAIYLLRYSAFAPPVGEGPVADIPGDNAAYTRAALDLYPDAAEDGFWEIVLHERIRDAGGRLTMLAEAEARYGRSYRFGSILRQRFLHGKHFSAFRIQRGAPWWKIVAVAPAVPAVMLLRIFGRVWGASGGAGILLTALPFLVPLTVAWAAGEAVGALTNRAAVRAKGAERS